MNKLARPQRVDSKVSEPVKELLEKKRAMKKGDIKNVEYSLLCKLIKRRLKE